MDAPVFADLSDGKKHDVKATHDIEFSTRSIVVVDRAYVDFNWMSQLDEQVVFFVIRGKENIKLELTERPLSPTDEANPHLQYDWQGYLSLPQSKSKYPAKLRMLKVIGRGARNLFGTAHEQFYLDSIDHSRTL